MKHIFIALLCAVFIFSTAHAAERYRWVDKSGKVHYGDTPPADAVEVKTKNIFDATSSDSDLPFATRHAQENFPVTLYVGNGCGDPCSQGRGLLKKRGIPFTEKNLQTQDDIDTFKKLTGSEGVPVLAVGKNYMNGFLDDAWHGALSTAGYPKDAPYRASPPPVAPVSPAAGNSATANSSEE